MPSMKQYEQAIDAGWKMEQSYITVAGKKLPRVYGDEGKKSELLKTEDWKLPELMVMKDGRPVTPELWPERRKELLDIVQEYGFGYTPAPPEKVDAEVLYSSASGTYAGVVKTYGGKAVNERIKLSFQCPYGEFSFNIHMVRPIYVEKPPVLIHLAFDPSLKDYPLTKGVDTHYAPIEEIIDNGFAYVHMCYNDIIVDTTPGFDFKKSFGENGIGKVFFQGEGRESSEWGKIAMWAYGGSRVVDYLMTRDDIDKDCISVAGHSRLGKTALWCAAQDERIFAGLVNCSGFGGAGLMVGLARDKFKSLAEGCQIEWWCEKAKEYQEDATLLPYDAHFIVAACAPRYVNILSADGDMTRYQLADFMSAAASSPAFENLGLKGFVSDEELPHPTVVYNEGHIGYALRPGSHFFSRWDWNRHMEFVLKHRKQK